MRKILYTLFFIATVVSCKKDETLRYNNTTMGNINGEEIISDQGNTFHISEKLFDVDLKSFESGRVMLMCDVLKETAAKTYDIRLTGITSVLTKEIKSMSDSTPEEDLNISNPLVIRNLWYAGGYLNLNIEIAQKKSSETKHFINLVLDSEQSKDGTYTFTLLHNAQGEVPTEDDREYSGAAGYVSFPISKIIKEDSAKIILKWKSHKYAGSGYSLTESEDLTREYNWQRQGYEHAPKAAVCKSGAELL